MVAASTHLLLLFGFTEGFVGISTKGVQRRRTKHHGPSTITDSIGTSRIGGSNRFDALLLKSSVPDVKAPARQGGTNALPLLEPFGVGIRRDFSRRLPLYKSDLTDGLNAQTLASTLFLFFACLSPAVGFGSVAQIATAGQIGVLEMCASTALCGVVYALGAAQPMQISKYYACAATES